jgi:hypothetical protein
MEKQKETSIEFDKVDILTTSLIAVLQTHEFQNEYTKQRQVNTLRLFAEMIEKTI